MQLTGHQIVDREIFNNYSATGIQQQGLDLRLDAVRRLEGEGYVGKDSTVIPSAKSLTPSVYDDAEIFRLDPGYYELELIEGCEIPSNIAVHLKTRSSLIRCGAEIRAGQFDAGFKTTKMGCFLRVERNITIERGARVCQALCFETGIVTNTYDGQFQNDKQRK